MIPKPKGKILIESFNYQGVSLDDGNLRRIFDEVKDYYLRIPNDDLLKGFRARAGKSAPGRDLGGWYSPDIFHVFGQILSGLSRMYAATGDKACRDKVNALVEGWGECIAPDGYFFYSTKPNAPNYVYEKTVCGLVDAYVYCNNKKALEYLKTITDWAEKNLDRKNEYSYNAGWGPTEWYTLSENLYRAWLATGDERYKEFGKVWEFTDYWNHFAKKTDIFKEKPFLPDYHAYSHVNTLSGAGAAYLVTGERHYLEALINAYDYFQSTQVFATGGYGPDERLLPPEKLAERLISSFNHFETQCGSWAAFKMCKYLMMFTGDARYGDWIELLTLNGIGASLPMSADGGVYQYSNYNLGGGEKQNIIPWSCCTGTRTQAVADFYDLVYFKDADNLYVNLFTASTVKWRKCHADITLKQRTRFPDENISEFEVSLNASASFGIRIRIPGWLSSPMKIKVNGKGYGYEKNQMNWAGVLRTWKNGEILSIELPMEFSAHRFPACSEKAFPAAIMKGPVVLAFRAAGNPSKKIEWENLEQAFIPSSGEPLTWHFVADPAVLVKPFQNFRQGESYFIYLDPDLTMVTVPHTRLKYNGAWIDGGRIHFTNQVGASVEYTFAGTGIYFTALKYDDAGKAEVRIDDKVVEIVDMFGPFRDFTFVQKYEGLEPGGHTIKITLLEDKNPDSRDRHINISSFQTGI
jgi:hypothetical protein